MAGMRIVVRIVLVAGALALLAPAGAQAGTYDVVSCAAPGADGVNNSLSYARDSFDPQYNPQVGGWYEGDGSCADGLVARSRTVDGTVAKWLTGAGWSFVAPRGNRDRRRSRTGASPRRATRAATTRTRRSWTRATTGASTSSTPAASRSAAPAAARRAPRRGRPACTFGAPGGGRAPTPARDEAPALAGQLRRRDHRRLPDLLRRLPARDDGRLRDAGHAARQQRPDRVAGGTARRAGLAPARRRADLQRERQLRHPLGDADRRRASAATDPRACDFTYPVPCANAERPRRCASPAPLPDGQYPVRLTVADAAGNRAAVDAPVAIDGTAPAVDLRRAARADDRRRRARHASGLRGRADLRPQQRRRAVPAAPDHLPPRQAARAARPRQPAHASTCRSRSATTPATRRRARRRGSGSRASRRSGCGRRSAGRARAGEVRPPGHDPRPARAVGPAAGRGRADHDHPTTPRVAGAAPSVEATGAVGAERPLRDPARQGPARAARIAFPGARARCRGAPAAARRAGVLDARGVPAAPAPAPGSCASAGACAAARAPTSSSCSRAGRAAAGARSRTPAPGRRALAASYRFSGRPGSYPIRARIRRQANLPYETGHSKRVTVHVG